jgi:acyl-CoA synthetase (AMP-forming)/AMP-acid ligase II
MTGTSNSPVNVGILLRRMAERQPFKRAVVYTAGRDKAGRPAYAHLTFKQLDEESDKYAHGLNEIGITRGTRTILMVRPSLEFFALTFAMFKAGAVPVVVDPGMGLGRMLNCLQEGQAEAFIGIPQAHCLRIAAPRYFRTVKIWVTVGRRWFWGGSTLKQLGRRPWEPYEPVPTGRDETAAILFTTGSTGPAKGAVYTHGTFDAQIRHIQEEFHIEPDEIDLPTFPLFALFDPALGMTAVIPDMDPTRPGFVDPKKIIEPILDHGVTNMFGSPALLNRVGQWGKERGLTLPPLRRVVSAGAPVSPANIEQFSALLSGQAQIFTPYGATEAVPVASIGSLEILSETKKLTESGYGMCVGRTLAGLRINIIRITDDPIEHWSEDLTLPTGEVGEIAVQGDLVTKNYFNRPTFDALAKINDGEGFWHRMGDLGWLDKKGRLWFCGRKSHRVITKDGILFTIPCEAIFNQHPMVFRSALVGLGSPPDQRPIICIELKKEHRRADHHALRSELLEMARSSNLTSTIETFIFKKTFPVDIRHNSKIFREELSVWAERKLH